MTPSVSFGTCAFRRLAQTILHLRAQVACELLASRPECWYGRAMATLDGPQRDPKNGGNADSFVILLHGISGCGDDMMFLADGLADALPGTKFYAPNAPHPYDFANDPKSNRGADFDPTGHYQWYNRFSERTRQQGLYEIAVPLNAFIAECAKENGLDESRGAVIGHSQGCMTGLNVVPRRSSPLGALIVHSGYLFSPDSLPQRKTQRERFFAEVKSHTPTCGIHGTEDSVQAWQMMQEAIATYDELGIPAEFHLIGGLGHAIGPRSIAIMSSFLQEHLPPIKS